MYLKYPGRRTPGSFTIEFGGVEFFNTSDEF